MRDRDLADSSIASEYPDLAAEIDTVSDLAKEAIAPFIPEAQRATAFAKLEEVLRAAEADGSGGRSNMAPVFEVLHAIYGDSRMPLDIRRQACSAAIGANHPAFGNAYQWYADLFGVTRACIHSDAREVQKKFGVRARRDKKDSAREGSRERASRPRSAATKGVRLKARAKVFSCFPGL